MEIVRSSIKARSTNKSKPLYIHLEVVTSLKWWLHHGHELNDHLKITKMDNPYINKSRMVFILPSRITDENYLGVFDSPMSLTNIAPGNILFNQFSETAKRWKHLIGCTNPGNDTYGNTLHSLLCGGNAIRIKAEGYSWLIAKAVKRSELLQRSKALCEMVEFKV